MDDRDFELLKFLGMSKSVTFLTMVVIVNELSFSRRRDLPHAGTFGMSYTKGTGLDRNMFLK
jgi:hypothetical protein